MLSPQTLETADPAALSRFDAIIDVRSPAEFAEDHAPGAINLPVLNNEERAIVGAIYVQESKYKARKIGAALVARNIALHLESVLADEPASFEPLVYCWRGGQRSNAMALIFSQIGWRTHVLKGGYRTYRRRVQARLYDEDLRLKIVLLDGETGCGKTAILEDLARRGVQTLDLEALAQHRGSLFGGFAGQPQPSQKMFESRLLAALEQLDPSRPILVEAESNKVGVRTLPPALWRLMLNAPRIELWAPRHERARYLVSAYDDIVQDRAKLDNVLANLPVHPGKQRLKDWAGLADAGDFLSLADAVMERHYDPAYARSRRTQERPRLAKIDLVSLSEADRNTAADAIVRVLEQALPGAHVADA
jgi:tRNA 2-selenouridine synthase